ncbi:D-allulose 6-phosphate 3-epimerase [Sporolactobacillus shoreicorticis]|uniref:D-allulose 6-phosphate 3-epimerase n=1 Tax=Sporolactobacillus shoreicorticis TaxID=1923877 RepID=A0ABW5S146_9BACL|nr:D-allulose 6-phosphate 3-epimerase [Sporolactobacillus shoreicorticis]MCO7128164.1 D-allulose 6-phosphate 3-epimerase [Sporolactobacillus shoreicorticis]
MLPKFSPSLMCMDLINFKSQINFLNRHADSYHVDIMDGHFVPNITLSPWFIEQLKRVATIPISVHLMVDDPAMWVDDVLEAGAEIVCCHAEAINGKAFRIAEQLHQHGKKFGVVINPETPVEAINPYLSVVDKVTVMSVDPGFAGQRFISETLNKITELKAILRNEPSYHYLVEIDGSCNQKTFKQIYDAGTDLFIIGNSGLFGLKQSIEQSWNAMREQFILETGIKL